MIGFTSLSVVGALSGRPVAALIAASITALLLGVAVLECAFATACAHVALERETDFETATTTALQPQIEGAPRLRLLRAAGGTDA